MMEIKKDLHGAIQALATLLTVLACVDSRCNNIQVNLLECTSGVQSRYDQLLPRVQRGNYTGVPQLCRMQETMNTCLHDELQDCGILGRQYLFSLRRRMKDVRKLCKDYKKMRKRMRNRSTKRPTNYDHDYQNDATVQFVVVQKTTSRTVMKNVAPTEASRSRAERILRTRPVTSVLMTSLTLIALVSQL